MQEFFKSGRYLFAIAIIAFGIIQFVTGNFMSSFIPVDTALTGRAIFLYSISTLFIVAGLTLFFIKTAGGGALISAWLFLAVFLYPHFFHLVRDWHNPGIWTGIAEILGFAGGGFILRGIYFDNKSANISPLMKINMMIGRILVAISLLIVGIQHLMYADYISTLIPSWIPFSVFWAYLIGVAFIASAFSILINIKTRLAFTLLGFMFLFWVIFLHAVRVANDRHKETEWTSLFVALGFCGIFFTIAGLYSGKKTA